VEYDSWFKKAGELTTDALKTSVIRRTDARSITPNLAPALMIAFSEAKYLLGLGYDLPEHFKGMYAHADVIRMQFVQLELLSERYNEMHRQLLEPERPLVRLSPQAFHCSREKV